MNNKCLNDQSSFEVDLLLIRLLLFHRWILSSDACVRFTLHPFISYQAISIAMPLYGMVWRAVSMSKWIPFKIVWANEILTIRWLFIYVSFDAIRDQTFVLDFYQMKIGFSLIFTCCLLQQHIKHKIYVRTSGVCICIYIYRYRHSRFIHS